MKAAQYFLAFARRGGDEQPTDINALVSQSAELFAYQLRNKSVGILLDLSPVPSVTLDAGSIQQVLFNLIRNAQEATIESRNKGTISIRTSYDANLQAVRIEITDNGVGIPADVQSRIFEPFFTTKPRGAGTGLGLAVSRRIIKEHEGNFSFVSTPGEGTTFIIELPARLTLSGP